MLVLVSLLFAMLLVSSCSTRLTAIKAKRFHGINRALCSGKANRDGLGKPKGAHSLTHSPTRLLTHLTSLTHSYSLTSAGYFDGQMRYVLEKQTRSGLPGTAPKPFIVLGIESSCDDTGVAVVRSDGVILSNVVYSQYGILALSLIHISRCRRRG